jgi:integrase/recombinase XerD
VFTNSDFALDSVELPPARKQNRRYQARDLSEADLAAIFGQLPDDRWRCVFAIAYFTGSRIGEVLSLQVSDIGSDRITIRAENTKMKKARVASLVGALKPFLAAYQAPPSGYLFPAHHNGKGDHLSRQGADRVLRLACDRVGLEGVSTHSFRRSFATNLHAQGYPLAKIARLLGHSSATMTARYVG